MTLERALFGNRIHVEIPLRRNAERIRHPIEEGKHSRDVHRFGYLRFCPPVVAQPLHIFVGGAIRSLGHLGYVVQKRPFCRAEPCFFQLSLDQRLYCLFFCSLNPQEVSV